MKLAVLDTKGKKIEDIEVSKEIFGQEANPDLLAQYLHVFRSNQRQGTSKVKTRAEVRGGGKKPWRQKGTGRARHGSIRSPIWVHGGIAHGPKPKSWNLSMPKKMKAAALKNALSVKQLAGEIKVLEKIDLKKPSTKSMQEIINNLKLEGKTVIVLSGKDDSAVKSIRNLPETRSTLVDNLNVYDVLDCQNLVLLKETVEKLEKKYQ